MNLGRRYNFWITKLATRHNAYHCYQLCVYEPYILAVSIASWQINKSWTSSALWHPCDPMYESIHVSRGPSRNFRTTGIRLSGSVACTFLSVRLLLVNNLATTVMHPITLMHHHPAYVTIVFLTTFRVAYLVKPFVMWKLVGTNGVIGLFRGETSSDGIYANPPKKGTSMRAFRWKEIQRHWLSCIQSYRITGLLVQDVVLRRCTVLLTPLTALQRQQDATESRTLLHSWTLYHRTSKPKTHLFQSCFHRNDWFGVSSETTLSILQVFLYLNRVWNENSELHSNSCEWTLLKLGITKVRQRLIPKRNPSV